MQKVCSVVILVGACILLFPKSNAYPAPVSGPKLFYKGQRLLNQGKYFQALALLKKAVKKLPHWGVAHLELARAQRQTGAPSSDIAKSLRLAEKHLPSNPRIYVIAGLFWEAENKKRKALRYYKKALKMGYATPEPCIHAAHLWLALNQGTKAIPCLQSWLIYKKQLATLHLLLAQANEQAKKIKQAARHWNIALSYKPHSPLLQQKVLLFYLKHASSRPRRERRSWMRTLRNLRRRILRGVPRQRKRKLRPLLPSRDQRKLPPRNQRK